MGEYFASLSLMGLVGRLPAGVAQGIIWGIMALGVYITFRLLDIADLSVDGTFSTGAAVTVMLILSGHNPWFAVLIAFCVGMLAGIVRSFSRKSSLKKSSAIALSGSRTFQLRPASISSKE